MTLFPQLRSYLYVLFFISLSSWSFAKEGPSSDYENQKQQNLSCAYSLNAARGGPKTLMSAISACEDSTPEERSCALSFNLYPQGVEDFTEAMEICSDYSPDTVSIGLSIFTKYKINTILTGVKIADYYSEDVVSANLLVPCTLSKILSRQNSKFVIRNRSFDFDEFQSEMWSCLHDFSEEERQSLGNQSE